MPVTNQHSPGTFCWIELATTEIDSALVFYSAVFGWDIEEEDLGDKGRYIRCRLNGHLVAAVTRLSAQQQKFLSKPIWYSYVATDDVAATLDKCTTLDGQRFEGPIAVPEAGTLGTIVDPSGALLCLWQAEGFTGGGGQRALGAPIWHELWTRDPEAAKTFYAAVFGWSPTTRDLGETDTTSFTLGGAPIGGLNIMDEALIDLPAQWAVYFAVANCAATIEAVEALDGSVRIPPTELPGVGHFAVLNDPQGGTFCIIQMFDLTQ